MAEILGSGIAFPLQVDRRGGIALASDETDVEFDLDHTDRGELLIHITYRLRATNHMRNLVYPFYVIPAEETAE